MKKNKGFSLIELLIAITLLAIIMIMVTQFMSTSTGALSRTKRNLNLQTEAMEIGEQLSDTLVQATYIRAYCNNGTMYTINNNINTDRKGRTVTASGKTLLAQLVCDNYPNLIKTGTDERKIILDTTNYSLVDEGGSTYPKSGDAENLLSVKSFRYLTSGSTSGSPYYVVPMFLYVRYQQKVNGGTPEDAYAIYFIRPTKVDGSMTYDQADIDHYELYMHRGTIATLTGYTGHGDGYREAQHIINNKVPQGPLRPEEKYGLGLVSSRLEDFYFSADTEENTVYLDFMLRDNRYKQYNYNYVESVMFRNSNVLTVSPQKLFKKK